MKLIALFLMVFVVSFPAWAVRCYTPETFQSEQLLRYRSQLMLTGMMCRKYAKGDPYKAYLAFVEKIEPLVQKHEGKLLQHFRQEKNRHPQKALHSLKTTIANETADFSAKFAPRDFCRAMLKQIQEAQKMPLSVVEKRLALVAHNPDRPSTRPLCVQPKQ